MTTDVHDSFKNRLISDRIATTDAVGADRFKKVGIARVQNRGIPVAGCLRARGFWSAGHRGVEHL